MGVIFKTKLSSVKQDDTARIDAKFHSLMNETGFDIFKTKKSNLTPLKNILKPSYQLFEFDESENYFGVPTGREFTNEFGDITSTQIITKDEHPDRLRYKADENCILISSLKGAKAPALNFDFDLSKYVFSNGFYIFQVDKKWNKKFVLYLLRTNRLKSVIDNNLYRGIGISSYKQDDFLRILIPDIGRIIQDKIVDEIQPIEKEINALKNSKLQPISIINQVFGEEFGFDWSEFENVKKEKSYKSSISKFANNIDCRMGIRFHNKAGAYIQSFLQSKTNKRIKDFLSEPIVLGTSVSPSDYDEEGEYFYIAMSNIKTWAFDPEDCKKVSESYAASNLNKTVKKGDILLARSGEGTIGKVALIEDEDINGIFADFTQRIRLKGFDPLCAYYYMRSDFFQYLVYTHKKGLGNNTNIFPSQIKEFPIPDWDETKQAEIVEKIKTQLDEQKLIDRQIEEKQQAINTIIEDAIKQEQN
ncbi:MAG: hypothetical protein SNJ77_09125 [Cytophagales bacterium]